jgi:hypothetical protein
VENPLGTVTLSCCQDSRVPVQVRQEAFQAMSTKPRPTIFIGTFGWSYKSWRGPFFPQTPLDAAQLMQATCGTRPGAHGLHPVHSAGKAGERDGHVARLLREMAAGHSQRDGPVVASAGSRT